MVSFAVKGRPLNGPGSLPDISACSAARARSIASGAIVTMALMAGLISSIRRRCASTTSTGETFRDRIRATSSDADSLVKSLASLIEPRYLQARKVYSSVMIHSQRRAAKPLAGPFDDLENSSRLNYKQCAPHGAQSNAWWHRPEPVV